MAEASIAVLQAPLAASLPGPHARGSGRGGREGAGCWDLAEGYCARAFGERRLGPPSANCQLNAARAVSHLGTKVCRSFFAAAFFAQAAAVIVVAGAAGAARGCSSHDSGS